VKRAVVLVVAIVLVGLSAAALEVRLRDGTVFEAASYTVNGSYLMVTLPGGQQVAYDVADVDLEALRAAESRAAEPAAPTTVAPELAGSRELADAAGGPRASGIAITDQDVTHTWQEPARPPRRAARRRPRPRQGRRPASSRAAGW